MFPKVWDWNSTSVKQSCENNIFPWDRLAIIQCIKIIKIYYKNGDSATVTYRALRGHYGLHNRLTTQAIGKIMKKFEGRDIYIEGIL